MDVKSAYEPIKSRDLDGVPNSGIAARNKIKRTTIDFIENIIYTKSK